MPASLPVKTVPETRTNGVLYASAMATTVSIVLLKTTSTDNFTAGSVVDVFLTLLFDTRRYQAEFTIRHTHLGVPGGFEGVTIGPDKRWLTLAAIFFFSVPVYSVVFDPYERSSLDGVELFGSEQQLVLL